MRSPFLFLLVVATSTALKCYIGGYNPINNDLDQMEQVCGRKVTHCALDVYSRHHGRIGLRCGDGDEVCDEGCTKRSINPDDITCCCKGDMCNDRHLVNRHKLKEGTKIEKEGSCLVGKVALHSKFKDMPVIEERCPTTMCMRKVVQNPRIYFSLECGSDEECQGLPECNNALAQTCCCVGKNCNYKEEKSKSVRAPVTKPVRVPVTTPSVEGVSEKQMIPVDIPDFSPSQPQWTDYFKNPKGLQGLISAIYKWFMELGKTLLKSLGIGKQYSE